jgi:hypothetical protein
LVGAGELGDGGAEDACLDDVIAPSDLGRAVPHAHPQLHARDHRAFGPDSVDVGFQLTPGVAPGSIDDVGPAGDLAVTRPSAGLPGGLPVVVARADRDAKHKPGRHPPRHDQLGEILPGQVRGKGQHRELRPARPDRSPERSELLPSEEKRPPRHPKPHHPVSAKLSALGCHPFDRRVPGLIHGPHQRAQRPQAVLLRQLS